MEQPTIADRVRVALALRHVTARDAANELGIAPSSMSRRMHGEMEFSASEVQKLAELLDVSIGYLYGQHDEAIAEAVNA